MSIATSCHVEVFKYIKEKGSISNADLDAALGPVAKIGSLAGHGAPFGGGNSLSNFLQGLGTCMKNKWVAIDKATKARQLHQLHQLRLKVKQ